MVFDFDFSYDRVAKKDFFTWLINTFVNNGWEYLSEGRSQDGYVFYSPGETGTEKIGVHIRDYYGNNTTRNFHKTSYGYISAKPFHTYKPSPNMTGLGTFEPSVSLPNVKLTPSLSIESMLDIYYHININRLILVVSHKESVSATFAVFGKPHTVAMTDEYNVSAVLGSHVDGSCISGVYNFNTKALTHNSSWRYSDLISGYVSENTQMITDVGVSNANDGCKYVLENIFITNYANSKIRNLNPQMENDIYVDSNDNRYKLFVNADNSGGTDAKLNTFLIKVGKYLG